MKVKIKDNRPVYWAGMQCYKVDYSIDGEKGCKLFDTYKEGIEWIKETFPEWFAKHYSKSEKEIT